MKRYEPNGHWHRCQTPESERRTRPDTKSRDLKEKKLTASWVLFVCVVSLFSERERQEIGQETQHAEDHHKRVMIDVTRLQQADNRRHPGDYFCAAIDDQAVDQAFVAGIPQATAKQTRATGKYPLIELIHVVLVVEQHIDGVKLL